MKQTVCGLNRTIPMGYTHLKVELAGRGLRLLLTKSDINMADNRMT